MLLLENYAVSKSVNAAALTSMVYTSSGVCIVAANVSSSSKYALITEE